jgi:hypothetical protein
MFAAPALSATVRVKVRPDPDPEAGSAETTEGCPKAGNDAAPSSAATATIPRLDAMTLPLLRNVAFLNTVFSPPEAYFPTLSQLFAPRPMKIPGFR